MNDFNPKESKIKKTLKITAIILTLILVIALYSLFTKYNNYANSGNTISEQQPFAKCDFAYKCTCPELSKKCTCIYYNNNEQPERIKCYNYN